MLKRILPEINLGIINSILMAVLAFLTVVLVHQLLLGLMSYLLNYETQITFGKVISKPFYSSRWSTARVLLMYAFPSAIFLFISFILAGNVPYLEKEIPAWYYFRFWWMVFSVLFISAQFTFAPLAVAIGQGPIYQGVAVVAGWWGVAPLTSIIFPLLSIGINLAFGFFSFRLIIQFSPSLVARFKEKGQQKIIRNYFLFPLLFTTPVVIFVSYPMSSIFFTAMLLHILLWLPGLYIKTHNDFGFEDIDEQISVTKFNKFLPVAVVILAALIRIFL